MEVLEQFSVGGFVFKVCDQGYLFESGNAEGTQSTVVPVKGSLTAPRVDMARQALMSNTPAKQHRDIERGCSMAMPFLEA